MEASSIQFQIRGCGSLFEGKHCGAPPLRSLPGRPRKKRREADEAQPGTSQSRRSLTLKCSTCKEFGHTKRSCQRAPVKKKAATTARSTTSGPEWVQQSATQSSECVTQAEDNAPSTSTQNARERGRSLGIGQARQEEGAQTEAEAEGGAWEEVGVVNRHPILR